MMAHSNTIILILISLAFLVTGFRTLVLQDFWVIETSEEEEEEMQEETAAAYNMYILAYE